MSKKNSTWRTKSPLATTIMDAMVDCVYGKLGVVTDVTPAIVVNIFAGELYVEPDGYIYEDLDHMPPDVWDEDVFGLVHATGRAYYDGDRWWNEYERGGGEYY